MEITSCLVQGSSTDWAEDQRHLVRQARQSHLLLAFWYGDLRSEHTLLVVEDDPRVGVHHVASPDQVDLQSASRNHGRSKPIYGRGDTSDASPLVKHAQVRRAVIDWCIVLQAVVRDVMCHLSVS